MQLKPSRVLVLAPHTDDGEFGCGGTIARLVDQGSTVHYVAFSDCRESLPQGMPPDTLATEVRAATRILGIPPANLEVRGHPVRRFNEYRQEILEYMVRRAAELDPDLVLMPSIDDLHQDHATVAQEGLRAFKRTTILSYEIPWNNLQFHNQLFVTLTERDVAAKVAALACYGSQANRHYANEGNVRAQATMRGCQIATQFAEVFEVVRAVVR